MQYGVKLEDFNQRWQEAIRQEDGSYSPRTESDAEERRFWADFIEQKTAYEPDPYSLPIAAFVTALLRENNIQSVLELGPGWGNYTIPIARACPQVSCVDISPDVLDYINRTLDKEGLPGADSYCVKWEDFDAPRRFDAVFAYNCFYRMRDIESCLRKLDLYGEKLHIIGMTSGPEQLFYREMEQELGLSIRYHRFDYIYLTNLLYGLGIDVNCKIIPLEKAYRYDTMEEVLRRETGRINDACYSEAKVRKILERHFRWERGAFQFIHAFKAAVLYW
jgi:SAM-dependent methyltransferase